MPLLLPVDARKRQRIGLRIRSVAAAWRNAGAGRRGHGFLFHHGQGSNRLTVQIPYAGGYWEYDEPRLFDYINISRDYADDIEAQAVKTGLQPFRTDLNVMLASGTNIQGQMEQVDTDLGYTWDSYTDPNSVRIGVNWGYTSSQLESQLDPELMIAIAAFLLLVIFTGYLIIYNIFQISVAGDIRFYGLLKTIGTTPRQLKRIIRQQALLLCLIGIPTGLLLGYGIGTVLALLSCAHPVDAGITTISTARDLPWFHAVCPADGAPVLFRLEKMAQGLAEATNIRM